MAKHEIVYHDPDGEAIGRGTIELLPGFQCTLGWSHSAHIHWTHRGKGLGTEAHMARLAKAKEIGFKYLMCSIRTDNMAQRAILKKAGWIKLHDLKTYCSTVELWLIDLQ